MKQLTKDELKTLYYKKSNKEICKYLGITNATLISYLKKSGIKLKGKGNRKSKSKIEIV